MVAPLPGASATPSSAASSSFGGLAVRALLTAAASVGSKKRKQPGTGATASSAHSVIAVVLPQPLLPVRALVSPSPSTWFQRQSAAAAIAMATFPLGDRTARWKAAERSGDDGEAVIDLTRDDESDGDDHVDEGERDERYDGRESDGDEADASAPSLAGREPTVTDAPRAATIMGAADDADAVSPIPRRDPQPLLDPVRDYHQRRREEQARADAEWDARQRSAEQRNADTDVWLAASLQSLSVRSALSPLEARVADWWLSDADEREERGARREECLALLYELLDDFVAAAVLEAKLTAPLPLREWERSQRLIAHSPPAAVVASAFNVDLHGKELRCLQRREWLNDEVINFYLQLLEQRSKRSHFFYAKLMEQGAYAHKNVARWTRKVDLFSFARVFCPVHVHGNHWCMGVLDMDSRTIAYYDSLGGSNPAFFKSMRRYLADEWSSHHTAAEGALSLSDWVDSAPRGVPLQDNGSDCGVFALKFADYLSHEASSSRLLEPDGGNGGAPLRFSAADMDYFRHRIALEIHFQCVL